jgi:trans-aconitate methyltransferase
MTNQEKQATIDRYNERLKAHGYNPKSLGWGEKDRAALRFEILSSLWDFEGKKVLDFGCGFGDLGNFISKKYNQFEYIGVDINENLVATGKEMYPNADLRVGDLLKGEFTEPVDFVLSSGVFNHKLSDNVKFIESCFEQFNQIATKGIAVNFLSDKVDFQYEYTYHTNPAWALDLAYKFSKRVVLRNDYMPFEFTIFIFKDEEINPDYTVYKDYQQFI